MGPGRFEAAEGPFRSYVADGEPRDDGSVREEVDFWLAKAYGPSRSSGCTAAACDDASHQGKPWWAPPDRFDATAATVLGLLGVLVLLTGYLGTLLTQTITFAADEFGSSNSAQGATLAAVRIGVLGSLVIAALADRTGRRKALLGSVAPAACSPRWVAWPPNSSPLGVSQTIVRGLTTAAAVLITIVAAEEMPASSRAFAISLLAMAGALGVGMCLWLLPLADIGDEGSDWRLLYVSPCSSCRWCAPGSPAPAREPALRPASTPPRPWPDTVVASGCSPCRRCFSGSSLLRRRRS